MLPVSAFRGRLARRLILWTVLFSGTLALIITVAQLLIEYRRDVALVDERFTLVEQSYLGSVIENVWVADRERLATLLTGITRLPDFAYAEVRVDGRLFVRVGTPVEGGMLRQWPLRYAFRGADHLIGELTVGADLAHARQRFIERAGFIIASNLIKTALVAGFLFLLVHWLITRHLERIGRYYTDTLAGDALDVPLTLERWGGRESDELDHLVDAINGTRERLRASYAQLREANQALEQRVAVRTQELRREVEIRQGNEQALAESVGQLQAIFEAALIGMVVIDEKGAIQAFNPAASRLFGYRADELIGCNISLLMTAEHSAQHDGYLQRYLDGGAARVIGQPRDVVGRRKDGSEFPLRLAVSESSAGGRRLFIGMLHDLTERRDFESALITAKLAAEQASAAKSEFLSRMSHELRTPLNAILGFSQLLASDRREPLSVSQRDSVDHILAGGRYLLELINEVLDLSRIEAGRIDLSLVEIDVLSLVHSCLRTLRPLADDAGVALHGPEPGTPQLAIADLTRLRQCVLNLLGNAIKYNRRGGEVFVEVDVAGEWLRLAVRDTGIGFDENEAKQLFQPFHRLQREGAVEGTGIGLALTRQLVELMGGRIEAAGEANVGATFAVYLRRADY